MHDPIPTGPGEHLVPDLALGPHPGPQDVLPPPAVLLQRLDRLLADHAPIGHDADPADPEAGSEAIGHGDQCRHVGRVAGPELAADRPALSVQHGPYDSDSRKNLNTYKTKTYVYTISQRNHYLGTLQT